MIAIGRVPRRQVLRFVPVVAWMLLIFVLSSRSQYPQPRERLAEASAIVVHLFTYGVLAVLLLRALVVSRQLRWTTVALAVALATAYGASDEIHQSFVTGRSATAFDVVVDGVGALVAAASSWWLGRRDADQA